VAAEADGAAAPPPFDAAPAIDDMPDPFDFAPVTNAAFSTVFTASATVTGFNVPLTATAVGGGAEVRKAGGVFGASATLSPGDLVEVRMTSAATAATASSALVTLGKTSATWVVTTEADCPAQTVSWTTGSVVCSVSSGTVLAAEQQRTIRAATVDAAGKVTITCTRGVLVKSTPTCELPVTIDLSSAAACENGYCSAVTDVGACGVVDETLANAICVTKGYGSAQARTTALNATGDLQCAADGTACFVSDNVNCNVIFTSVTCVH
jgi:hypothetical protein